MPTQKTPFAIHELLGLSQNQENVKSSPSSNNLGSHGHGPMGLVSQASVNFPPISCYNSSFFNSSAVDSYSLNHQRMSYFNSAGAALFGNLHHQSQSFASASAASHLLDSTLRNSDSLSSKSIFLKHIFSAPN